MIDYSRSMQQSYEYYSVDTGTWENASRIENVKSSTITYDAESDTRGSASFEMDGNISEQYVRTYLLATQDGRTERVPLGTHLIQSPSRKFDGKREYMSVSGYTSLIELAEDSPPIGYFIARGTNILDATYRIAREHARAPVIRVEGEQCLGCDFVANTEDTWMTFLRDLLAQIDYHLDVTPLGEIIARRNEDIRTSAYQHAFRDDDKSIMFSDISVETDLFEVPNVVEVSYTDDTRMVRYFSSASNDNESSIVSTIVRGRRILYREANPQISGEVTQEVLDEYVEELLRKKSQVVCVMSLKYAFCNTALGEHILIDYRRADVRNVHAVITRQVIHCATGCSVEATASFSKNLMEA